MKLISEIRQEETKDRLIQGAFIGFQMGAGGEKTFGEYLEKLGFAEKQIGETENITKEEAIKRAERIRERLRKK